MFKKYSFLIPVFLAGFLPLPVRGAGQAPPPPPLRKPIVCKWTTLQGMRYYYDGDQIDDDQSLENLITPLKDPEADRLLALSSSSQASGVAFLVGGTVLVLSGFVVAGDNYDGRSKTFNSTGTVGIVGALIGLVGDYVGAFKLEESKTSKFAAVQRYNAIVHGDVQTSWGLPERGINMNLMAWNF